MKTDARAIMNDRKEVFDYIDRKYATNYDEARSSPNYEDFVERMEKIRKDHKADYDRRNPLQLQLSLK